MKKKNIGILILFIIIPLVVGGISAYLTKDAMTLFKSMKQPPLSPPGILFPIVWTILYILMGISSYLVYTSKNNDKKNILVIYFIQLCFNFFWSILFFRFSLYWIALVWLIVMYIFIILYTVKSRKVSVTASNLFIPYILWCTFACYLNIMIAILN